MIIISSDDESNDERAVEASAMRTLTQTFVLTFRKQTRYIGDEVISTSICMEKDYYDITSIVADIQSNLTFFSRWECRIFCDL